MSKLTKEESEKLNIEASRFEKAVVVASASYYGFKFFEVHLRSKDNSTLGIVNLTLSALKVKGIVSRLNSMKKLQIWLDTQEGLLYAIDNWKIKREREVTYYR